MLRDAARHPSHVDVLRSRLRCAHGHACAASPIAIRMLRRSAPTARVAGSRDQPRAGADEGCGFVCLCIVGN